MPYRSSEKTRQKKDAKRNAIMQAAVTVFADKGYHAATVRDVVKAANVAIGTFYFYFPDKETLFVYLYEETADFLLQTLGQAVTGRSEFQQQLAAGLQAYLNLATYQPSIVQLLLVGGVGAVPALQERRATFRERMTAIWYNPIEAARAAEKIPDQNTRRTAEAFAGAFDEVILNLLDQPNPELEASAVLNDLVAFALRAVGFVMQPGDA